MHVAYNYLLYFPFCLIKEITSSIVSSDMAALLLRVFLWMLTPGTSLVSFSFLNHSL
jgi:hypothetical protein